MPKAPCGCHVYRMGDNPAFFVDSPCAEARMFQRNGRLSAYHLHIKAACCAAVREEERVK